VVVVLFLPLRALSLLLFGQRFKAGVVRLGAYDSEAVVHQEAIRGEAAARARGCDMLSQLVAP
jgi:hypothetical protein